jgi:alpha-beta hydrolase superfamily lysophospholipase
VSKKLDSAKVIFVLGFGNGGVRGSFSELTADLDKLGISCVVPCMPGQDASPEPHIGFGDAEAQVLTDTVAWVREHRADHPKVVLLGVSMGGAAAWLSVDKGVQADGIVTESGYAELAPTVWQFFNRRMKGGAILFRPVVWIAEARSGIRVASVKPVLSAARWHKPALIIQAGDDNLVSPSQGEELVAATHGQYWLVAGAEHAGCYEHDAKTYVDRLVEFADKLP